MHALTVVGRINRHRTHTPPVQYDQNTAHTQSWTHSSLNPSARSSALQWQTAGSAGQGRGRGRIGKIAPNPHRNRTLVLNQTNQASISATEESTPDSAQSPKSTVENGITEGSESPQTAKGWVTKRDRHMQLINSSIYDKEAQSRNKAIEETRKQKIARRNQREKQKIERHLKSMTPRFGSDVAAHTLHEITINGLRFQVLDGGGKLARIRG